MTIQNLKSSDFSAATEAAALSVVDFWADWCGPCKMMAPAIHQIAEQYEGKVLVAKVNIDDEPSLAQQFGIMSIPTVVILKNGREIDRKVGVQPAEMITRVLEQNL